jgi:Putative Flp pilus-assembly TadE/G-like
VGSFKSHREGDDERGVILVFWVLCLSLLAALFVGVLALGNLLQSSDNAQNAADAAALAGEDIMGPALSQPGGLVVSSIFIPRNDQCLINSRREITACASGHYGWLSGNYIYEGDQWLLIGSAVSPTSALSYASKAYPPPQYPAPAWICPSLWPPTKKHPARYCDGINVYTPGPPYGLNASLTNSATFDAAANAITEAEAIQKSYGFTSYSGCSAPANYFLVEAGVTCIGYDPGGTVWVTVPDPALIDGTGLSPVQKTSWATTFSSGTVGLCSPPSENCN